MLQDPERGGFLCASERLLVSRYLDSDNMAPLKAQPRPEISALVAVANPIDLEQYNLAPIDIVGEVERCARRLPRSPPPSWRRAMASARR